MIRDWFSSQSLSFCGGPSLSVDLGGSCTEASFGDETDAGLGWFLLAAGFVRFFWGGGGGVVVVP